MLEIPEIQWPTLAEIDLWSRTIDWWALIIMILMTAIIVVMYKTQSPKVATFGTLMAILGLVIGLANIYPTPMDFIIFWGKDPTIFTGRRW